MLVAGAAAALGLLALASLSTPAQRVVTKTPPVRAPVASAHVVRDPLTVAHAEILTH